jgi:hypothetical protein
MFPPHLSTQTLSEAEVDAEKATKPRVDLIPGYALTAVGHVQAYGVGKHGQCTWRNKGTRQAMSSTHIASAMRHMAEYLENPDAVEQGSMLPVLWHAAAQLMIAIDCKHAEDKESQDE